MDALWTALADIMWTAGEKKFCYVCLPQENATLQHSSTYFADGITEFVSFMILDSAEENIEK